MPAASESGEPLMGARPSLLGTDELSGKQARLDERIRTLSLVTIATAIVGLGLYHLRTILIRFVLALALRYLLTPLIDALSCSQLPEPCHARLPRPVATLVALVIAIGGLFSLGLVVVRSISSFGRHADQYQGRVEVLLAKFLELANFAGLQDEIHLSSSGGNSSTTDLKVAIADLVQHRFHLSSLIVELLGKAGEILEDTIYILLFLAFLLAGSQPSAKHGQGGTRARADEQIFLYIRGKAAVALLVAAVDSCIYWALGLSLWLVFGVLAFWLSFVPNVGVALSVCLPLPVVLLEPSFSTVGMALAFGGPVAMGLVAKDIIEPLLIGHSTSLTPVAVLLAVMVWGSIWGVSGMVLAVPLTAVLRLYLAGLDHPIPRYVAAILSGQHADGEDEEDEEDHRCANAMQTWPASGGPVGAATRELGMAEEGAAALPKSE